MQWRSVHLDETIHVAWNGRDVLCREYKEHPGVPNEKMILPASSIQAFLHRLSIEMRKNPTNLQFRSQARTQVPINLWQEAQDDQESLLYLLAIIETSRSTSLLSALAHSPNPALQVIARGHSLTCDEDLVHLAHIASPLLSHALSCRETNPVEVWRILNSQRSSLGSSQFTLRFGQSVLRAIFPERIISA